MSRLVEINFDGIVGPSHNYAGLSLGNIASASHGGDTSYPRAAALQGVEKMRANMGRGLAQGYLLPLPRPNGALLDRLAVDAASPRQLLAAAWSASSMWTANAATISPARPVVLGDKRIDVRRDSQKEAQQRERQAAGGQCGGHGVGREPREEHAVKEVHHRP